MHSSHVWSTERQAWLGWTALCLRAGQAEQRKAPGKRCCMLDSTEGGRSFTTASIDCKGKSVSHPSGARSDSAWYPEEM